MNEGIMAFMQEGVSLILQIAVFGALLFLRTFKNKVQTYYTSKTTHQERLLLAQLGREAFALAETVYRGHDGPAKLNEAIKYLLDRAKEHGLGDVPMMDARAMIEAAWLESNRAVQAMPPSGVVKEVGVVSDEIR